jgi:hypothetical protein
MLRAPFLLSVLCAWALPGGLHAQTTHDEQAWINLTATGPVAEGGVYFIEVQPRIGDGVSRLDALLLRGGVGLKLSPSVTLFQGYAHIVSPVSEGRDVNEERSFQQLNLDLGNIGRARLSSRTRLEQRWRSDGGDMGWRLRELVRVALPVRPDSDAVKAVLYTEGFLALNDTDWGARGGFDQLRTFAGLELALPGDASMDVGYLNNVIDRGGGAVRMNHVAAVTVTFRP